MGTMAANASEEAYNGPPDSEDDAAEIFEETMAELKAAMQLDKTEEFAETGSANGSRSTEDGSINEDGTGMKDEKQKGSQQSNGNDWVSNDQDDKSEENKDTGDTEDDDDKSDETYKSMEKDEDADTEDDDTYDLNAIMAKRNRYSVKNIEKARAKAVIATASAMNTAKPSDPKQKRFRFGLQFTRVESSSKVSILPSSLRELIQSIAEVDDEATILSHNNSEIKAMPIQQFISNKGLDYKTYFDSHVVRWGHIREDKWRLVFSFYLASDIVEPNLKQLRNNMDLVQCLKNNGLSMAPHTLHESRDETLGFLLGKSQQFTWIGDIKERLQNHLKTHLNKAPEISIKPRTVKFEEITADVLLIFVGKQDFRSICETLKKHPFSEVDIVMQSLKYEGKESYKQQLQIHNKIQESSKAIKLCNITESQVATLRNKCESDPQAKMRIVDFARYKNSDENKVVYVQFHEAHKDWVTNWLKMHVGKEPLDNTYMEDRETGASGESARTSKTQKTQITYESRFQYMWNDKIFESKETNSIRTSRSRGGIPPAIAVEKRSYASATRASHAFQAEQSSRGSSPDRSMDSSLKTRREIELEEKVEELNKQNQTLKKANQKLQERNEAIENELEFVKDKLKEMQVQQEYAFEQHTIAMEAKFQEKFESLQQMVEQQITMQQQKSRRSNSPRGMRKRKSVRDTPEKMKREVRNLQSREGDIWYERSQDEDEDMATETPHSRSNSPAEAAPDPGGASAKPT